MKTTLLSRWTAALMVGFISLGLFPSQDAKAENFRGVSFQVFYDELMPYGDWVKDANYGYIWLPAVGQDFHPYGTNGHWVMTEFGNTWVSYYDWGWAPFHYGRWYFDDYYQSWAWVPGYDWGPAWVSWRSGGGHYGWAPLGPRISVSVGFRIPSFHWVFLPHRRMYDPYGWRYYASHNTRVKIINRTKIINNTVVYNNNTYIAGPSRREVEQLTRRRVNVYNVRQSDRPGRANLSRNEVNLYRPDLARTNGRSVEARPSRVVDSREALNRRSSSAANPSRSRTMDQAPSSRSANPAIRNNPGTNRAATGASRSGTLQNRNSSPRSAGGQTFESRPYQTPKQNGRSVQTRTAPNSSRQGTVSRPASPARQSTVRTSPSRGMSPNSSRVQQSRPTPEVKKAPAPTRQRSVQSTPPGSNTRVQAPASRNTRVQAPARSNTRVQAPARSSSTKKVPTRSSGSSRGNGRNN
ncbi:DUF6600 domain-containing protein [Algoriphagus sp.]|uniref:DUF6600 domain-containing protein n=1 Tax=Algoriphagus sp. TaxID=1872435 RepID=UPI0026241E2B|nr:DUF6600 domain-containing protein [Algoriphagus sp.]